MKKNYNVEQFTLLPKKSTIDFLLQFSKSVSFVKGNHLGFLVSKN